MSTMIDWGSDDTALILNPRLSAEERRVLKVLAAAVPSLRAHIWIASSGTGGTLKLVALSKEAILASAAAVNEHLEADGNDRWSCVLPAFHVGGIGIYARAHLNGAPVIAAEWDPHGFVRDCEKASITLSALVPAQVHDLVRGSLRAPRTLRAIVVGGGAMHERLYVDARALGWPVLPSYGMTECCSQVATASLSSVRGEVPLPSHEAQDVMPPLVLLGHLQARMELDGSLAFSGTSLFTGYAMHVDGEARFVDPKVGGWFISEDIGRVDGRVLRPTGRAGEFVKIGGESVDLARLDRILLEAGGGQSAAVVPVEDERLGHVIHLAVTGSAEADSLVASFNVRVLPFERIRSVHRISVIPRSPLGKLLRWKIAEELVR